MDIHSNRAFAESMIRQVGRQNKAETRNNIHVQWWIMHGGAGYEYEDGLGGSTVDWLFEQEILSATLHFDIPLMVQYSDHVVYIPYTSFVSLHPHACVNGQMVCLPPVNQQIDQSPSTSRPPSTYLPSLLTASLFLFILSTLPPLYQENLWISSHSSDWTVKEFIGTLTSYPRETEWLRVLMNSFTVQLLEWDDIHKLSWYIGEISQ